MSRLTKSLLTTATLVWLFAMGCSFFYQKRMDMGYGVFSISRDGNSDNLITPKHGELLKGAVVSGCFKSVANKLGIVAVRFDNQGRSSDDVLIFRIRELSSSTWYYQAEYKTDQFTPGELFPFGFKPINDSKDKSYYFELQSIGGGKDNSIFISPIQPKFEYVTSYDKNLVGSSFESLKEFVKLKAGEVARGDRLIHDLLISFIPFLLALVFTLSGSIDAWIVLSTVLLTILWETSQIRHGYLHIYISLGIFWLLIRRKKNFESYISGLLAMIFLMITIVTSVMGYHNISEKYAIWAYIFLINVLISQIFPNSVNSEIKAEKKIAKLSYKQVRPYLLIAANLLMAIFYLRIMWEFWHAINIFVNFSDIFASAGLYKELLLKFSEYTLFSLIWIVFVLMTKSENHLAVRLIIVFLGLNILSRLTGSFTAFSVQPMIYALQPQTTREAWVDVTVKGVNLEDMPFEGRLLVDGDDAAGNVIRWSDKEVIFRTNPAVSKSGKLCVKTHSKGTSNCLQFIYLF